MNTQRESSLLRHDRPVHGRRVRHAVVRIRPGGVEGETEGGILPHIAAVEYAVRIARRAARRRMRHIILVRPSDGRPGVHRDGARVEGGILHPDLVRSGIATPVVSSIVGSIAVITAAAGH
jgi:hypothetical protein